jgi:hypothetical protein
VRLPHLSTQAMEMGGTGSPLVSRIGEVGSGDIWRKQRRKEKRRGEGRKDRERRDDGAV